MNRIVGKGIEKTPQIYCVENLCGRNFRRERTAFIGSIEPHQQCLFLITYSGVSKANDPNRTWTGTCTVEVIEFVDIDIIVKNRTGD